MRRVPRQNNIGPTTDPWNHCRWEVTLHVNARQCVEGVSALCERGDSTKNRSRGRAYIDVSPFDDLSTACSAAMLESALAAQDDESPSPSTWVPDPSVA